MNTRIYNYSIHLLARQDYSEYKLRQKLRSKKDNLPHEVEEVVEALKTRGILKEENYRRLFIRKWMMKGEAKDKIIKRGAQEKIYFNNAEFDQVSKELNLKQEDNLNNLINKKLRYKTIPDDYKERSKLRDKTLRYLISKGYSFEDSRIAIDIHMKNSSS